MGRSPVSMVYFSGCSGRSARIWLLRSRLDLVAELVGHDVSFACSIDGTSRSRSTLARRGQEVTGRCGRMSCGCALGPFRAASPQGVRSGFRVAPPQRAPRRRTPDPRGSRFRLAASLGCSDAVKQARTNEGRAAKIAEQASNARKIAMRASMATWLMRAAPSESNRHHA